MTGRVRAVLFATGVVAAIAAPASSARSWPRIDLRTAPVLRILEEERFAGALGLYAAGDVNGDGHEDLIAKQAGEGAHELDVLFGPFPTSGPMDLGDETHLGFRIFPDGLTDAEPSAAGDVNGDGMDDLIIGAPNVDDADSGRSYVVFGKADSVDVNLADFGDSTTDNQGFLIVGSGFLSLSGSEVDGLGDLNGDGLDDVMVGAPFAPAVYVVFGKADGVAIDLGDLYDKTNQNGYVIVHPSPKTNTNWDANAAGDFNDDGLVDVVVGLHRGRNSPGGAWIVYGKGDGALIDVSNLGSDGVRIRGAYGSSGEDVSAAGDWNGDGCDDVAIGAEGRKSTYVVYGCSDESKLFLTSLGKKGSEMKAPDGKVITFLSGGTDVNGDGFDEIAVGEPDAAPHGRKGAGTVFIVLGGDDLGSIWLHKNMKRVVRVDGADARTYDYPNYPGDYVGVQIDLTRDIDGDGRGDLIAGAYDPNNNYEGRAYVVWSSVMWP